MEKKEVIYFELLGQFPYEIAKKAGKKTLSLLQYLIMNHSRAVSAEELIDVFWPESRSADPANALRNMLYKVRSLLKMIFAEHTDLLQTLQGCYVWNPKVNIELDTERFEELCLQAGKCSKEERCGALRQAAKLYRGDFLSGNDSEWAREPRQYYRTLYLDACKSLLPLLEEREQWMEIIAVCGQAYQVDFCMEEFTACQMRAFIAAGQPEEAIEKYESYQKRLFEELEMSPTEQLEQIYALAVGLRKNERADAKEIFELVCEDRAEKQAFFCSFGMFQSIVALEKRHLARTGLISTLVIVSLGKDEALTTNARRLARILQEGLRTGDPVARLTAGSYILMLTGTDTTNAQIVISRLDSAFHRTYRHSGARLSFRLYALRPEKEEKNNNLCSLSAQK